MASKILVAHLLYSYVTSLLKILFSDFQKIHNVLYGFQEIRVYRSAGFSNGPDTALYYEFLSYHNQFYIRSLCFVWTTYFAIFYYADLFYLFWQIKCCRFSTIITLLIITLIIKYLFDSKPIIDTDGRKE